MTRKHSTGLQRWRAPALAAQLAALLLCACTKVNITPLGTTSDGRRQYELACNKRATADGSCHRQAVELCEGSYETQNVGSIGSGVSAYNGRTFTTPVERVLLIACNRRQVSDSSAEVQNYIYR